MSSFNGKDLKLISPEMAFQDPDLVKNNKDQIMPVGKYIDLLYSKIEDSLKQREDLKDRVPENVNDFLSRSEEITKMFEDFSLVEYTKLKTMFIKSLDQIKAAYDNILEEYKQRIETAKTNFLANTEFIKKEVYSRYHIISDFDDLTKSSLISRAESSEDPCQYLQSLESQLDPALLDRTRLDAYSALLLNRLYRNLEEPPSFSPSRELQGQFEAIDQGVKLALGDIKKRIDETELKNVKINLLQERAVGQGLAGLVSRDGFSASQEINKEKKMGFKLVDKVLTDDALTCIHSIDDSLLCGGSHGGKLSLFSLDDKELLSSLNLNTSTITSLASLKTPSGKLYLLAGSDDTSGEISVVEAFNFGKKRQLVGGHSGGVCALATLKDGRSIISGGQDGCLCLWDFKEVGTSEGLVRKLPAHRVSVSAIRVCEEAGKVFTASRDGQILEWKMVFKKSAGGQHLDSLELVIKLERPYPVANIIIRQALAGDQIISVCVGGTTVEVIDMKNQTVTRRFESNDPTENFVIIEDLHRDGESDFAIMNTNMPGDARDPLLDRVPNSLNPNSLTSPLSSPLLNLQSLGDVFLGEGAPKVQLIQKNKKALLLAKISNPGQNRNCINLYDIVS